MFEHVQRICENGNEFFCSVEKYNYAVSRKVITRLLRSSVFRASDYCLEGRGFNSHLELRMFFEFFSPHIFYLLRKKKSVYLVLK